MGGISLEESAVTKSDRVMEGTGIASVSGAVNEPKYLVGSPKRYGDGVVMGPPWPALAGEKDRRGREALPTTLLQIEYFLKVGLSPITASHYSRCTYLYLLPFRRVIAALVLEKLEATANPQLVSVRSQYGTRQLEQGDEHSCLVTKQRWVRVRRL